jgi:hypothetical protein
MLTILKKFQKAPEKSKLRRDYFRDFEKKMIYRTTKTENPEVTFSMVKKILNKFSA